MWSWAPVGHGVVEMLFCLQSIFVSTGTYIGTLYTVGVHCTVHICKFVTDLADGDVTFLSDLADGDIIALRDFKDGDVPALSDFAYGIAKFLNDLADGDVTSWTW